MSEQGTWAKAFNDFCRTKGVDGSALKDSRYISTLVEVLGVEFDSMDTRLEMLEAKAEEPPPVNPIVEARAVLREHLEKDEGFKQGYLANVAMLIHDELFSRGYKPKLRPVDRNAIAEGILRLLFWD